MSSELDTKLFYIYKIVCKDLNIKSVYVGSTNNFLKRECIHKTTCKARSGNNYNLKLYRTIRENGNWDNWNMSIIYTGNYVNQKDKLIKEREYIDELGADLNMTMPYVTVADLEKSELKSYNTKYYADNRKKLLARQSEKLKCPNCERWTTYNFMTKHKQTKVCIRNTKPKSLEETTSIQDLIAIIKMQQEKLNKITNNRDSIIV